jgi:4-hydroxy-3-polyprenylbenzoate decarboxylase
MTPDHDRRVVIGVTGASGSVYAQRTVQALLESGFEVHLSLTPAGLATWAYEMGAPFSPDPLAARGRLVMHRHDDLFSATGSGSWRHGGMAVVPCSVKTLAAIAAGFADNVVTRAADVALKERRKLVLLVREAPLSRIHLENMLRVDQAGAVVIPASPGFYHHPKTVDDLVDFVVARVLDQLGCDHPLTKRWREPGP